MIIITFTQIADLVAAHAAAEAAEQLPLAVALRALDALREALPLLTGTDRDEVVDELRVLLAEQDDRSWEMTQDLATMAW